MGKPDDNILSAEDSRNWREVHPRVQAELDPPRIISNKVLEGASTFKDAPDESGKPVKYMDGGFSVAGGKDAEIFLPDAIGKPRSLLRLHRNDEEETIAVSSEYDRRFTAILLEKALTPEVFADLKASLRNTELKLEISDADRAAFKAYNDDYQQHRTSAHTLLLAAEKIPSPPTPVFPLEKAQKVKQGEGAFVEAGEHTQALEASGAWENIILATYNAKEQRMGMLYIDSATKANSIDTFLARSKGVATAQDPVQVHLLGGMVTGADMMGSILERIEHSDGALKLSSFCPYSSYGSLAICKNGNVFKELPGYLEQEAKIPTKAEEPAKLPLKPEVPPVIIEKPLTQNDAAAILKQFPMLEADVHAAPQNGLLSAPLAPRQRGNTPP